MKAEGDGEGGVEEAERMWKAAGLQQEVMHEFSKLLRSVLIPLRWCDDLGLAGQRVQDGEGGVEEAERRP